MPHSAYFIVEEFLRSPDPQSRKNALTALAVMAEDEQCAERLAESALTDADAGVRKRALAEIVSLPEGSLERAAWTAWNGLKDESTEQNAYAVLGHLRGIGKPVPKPEGALPQYKRFVLAWGLKNHLNPARDWTFRLRAWKTALAGGLLGIAAVMIAFFKMTDWSGNGYYVIPPLLLMLAVAAGVAAAQHTTPVNLYYDSRPAFLVEVGAAVAYSLLAAVPLLLVLAISGPEEAPKWLTVILGVPVVVGAARAATLLSYGVAKGRRRNVVLQTLVAAGTLLLLLTAFNFFIWLFSSPSTRLTDEHAWAYRYSYAGVYDVYMMLEAAWIALFPVGLAAALSFAVIDNKSAPVRPAAGRLSKIFSYLVIVLSAALVLGNWAASYRSQYKTPNVNSTFNKLFGP